MMGKMLPVPNEGHRWRQKQRRRRFPWGSIATVILVVAVCVYAFTLFGDKESPKNSHVNDDWNLVLVNHENAIPRKLRAKTGRGARR